MQHALRVRPEQARAALFRIVHPTILTPCVLHRKGKRVLDTVNAQLRAPQKSGLGPAEVAQSASEQHRRLASQRRLCLRVRLHIFTLPFTHALEQPACGSCMQQRPRSTLHGTAISGRALAATHSMIAEAHRGHRQLQGRPGACAGGFGQLEATHGGRRGASCSTALVRKSAGCSRKKHGEPCDAHIIPSAARLPLQ